MSLYIYIHMRRSVDAPGTREAGEKTTQRSIESSSPPPRRISRSLVVGDERVREVEEPEVHERRQRRRVRGLLLLRLLRSLLLALRSRSLSRRLLAHRLFRLILWSLLCQLHLRQQRVGLRHGRLRRDVPRLRRLQLGRQRDLLRCLWRRRVHPRHELLLRLEQLCLFRRRARFGLLLRRLLRLLLLDGSLLLIPRSLLLLFLGLRRGLGGGLGVLLRPERRLSSRVFSDDLVRFGLGRVLLGANLRVLRGDPRLLLQPALGSDAIHLGLVLGAQRGVLCVVVRAFPRGVVELGGEGFFLGFFLRRVEALLRGFLGLPGRGRGHHVLGELGFEIREGIERARRLFGSRRVNR
mmetsp:Transcript_2574/g.9641  ORF Transcript_2574/g.9641 Transcript_2574/m.9641 type:complete len:352 (+) Transcript_2574:127-1182(+)